MRTDRRTRTTNYQDLIKYVLAKFLLFDLYKNVRLQLKKIYTHETNEFRVDRTNKNSSPS